IAVWISQPSTAPLLQSVQPASQATTAQAPATQPSTPCGVAPQAWPQVPQLLMSVSVDVSQPLAALLSQSVRPPVPCSVQAPPTQAGVAFGPPGHIMLHAPQFRASVAVLVSQPSSGIWLQSAWRASHDAIVQLPAVQAAVPLATGGHALPQEPQLL